MSEDSSGDPHANRPPTGPSPGARKPLLKRVNLEETCYTIVAHSKRNSLPLEETAERLPEHSSSDKRLLTARPHEAGVPSHHIHLVKESLPNSQTRLHLTTTTTTAISPSSSSSGLSPTVGALEHTLSVMDMQAMSGHAVVPSGISVTSMEAMNICLSKLQQITEKMKSSNAAISEDIAKEIQSATSVLSQAYCQELSRRIQEADSEELSEVSPSSVPQEVIEWLESTFTRTKSTFSEDNSIDRLKFRSVATAITAGIFVDKISRKQLSILEFGISEPMEAQLKSEIDWWSFDPFKWNESLGDSALKCIVLAIFCRYDVINKYKIPTSSLEIFLALVHQGYSKYGNAYHNAIHAADVLQTCHSLAQMGQLPLIYSDLEIFALLFAALIHDYEHTGTSNAYHVNSASKLAILYNDRGVLENHHVSAIFQRFLTHPECNILRNMDSVAFKIFRGLVIEMVLNTDMSLHFHQVKTMRAMLTLPENIEKSKVLSFLLHAADISHPTKCWELHHKWSCCLCEEFFRQGDREKEQGLPVSPMCDRDSANLPQGQIGFIDAIVSPTFEVMGELFSRLSATLAANICKTAGENKEKNGAENETMNNMSAQTSTEGNKKRPWREHMNANKSKWIHGPEHSSKVDTSTNLNISKSSS